MSNYFNMGYTVTFFFLTIGCVIGVYIPHCPKGWIPYNYSCYVFIRHAKEDWSGAGFVCNQLKAKLVEIETGGEQGFLSLHAADLRTSESFWIGGSDQSVDGEWRWMRAQHTMSYTAWGPAQPTGGSTSNCASLSPSVLYKWDDISCDAKISFICEHDYVHEVSNIDNTLG